MKRIKLKMFRDNLENIPQFDLPEGYSIRKFREGDEIEWAKIETAAEEFKTVADALKRFDKEFGSNIEEMKHRCLFIENEDGEAIGTTSAWFGDLDGTGEQKGRIHFVAIKPEYQGKKLSKPLLTAALNTLIKENHNKVYLTTQTTSYQAINMYLNYGFEPYDPTGDDREGWSLMEEVLNRKLNILN